MVKRQRNEVRIKAGDIKRLATENGLCVDSTFYNDTVDAVFRAGLINREARDASVRTETTALKAYAWTVVSDLEVRTQLRRYSICASELFHRASLICNMFFMHVESVDRQLIADTFEDQTFWKTLILPEKFPVEKRHPRLNTVLEDHTHILNSLLPSWWERPPKSSADHPGLMSRSGWDNTCNFLGTTLKTNAELHVTRNIVGRVKRRLRRICDDPKHACAVFMGAADVAISDEDRQRVASIRAQIDSDDLDDIKLTPSVLQLHIKLAHLLDNDRERFSVMPVCRFQRMFARVDRRVFTHLCPGKDFETALNLDPTSWRARRKAVRKVARRHARRRKTKKRVAGIGKLPDGRVSSFSTDGVGIVLTFEREARHPFDARDMRCIREGAVHIGVDPGRASLITTAEVKDGVVKCHQLTRKEYYGRALINKQRKWTQTRPMAIHTANAAMADAGGLKNCDPQKWRDTLTSFVDTVGLRRVEYMECDEYAKWRMTLWRKKRSVLANRVNDVLQHARRKERDVVVGYGAAKFVCTGRGERAVPTTGTFKYFIRAFREMQGHINGRVVMVDEFNTTKCCHRCGSVLDKIYKDVEGRSVEVRGIRLCHTCGEQDKPLHRNRDLNAARNILAALVAHLTGRMRPLHLQRRRRSEVVVMAIATQGNT